MMCGRKRTMVKRDVRGKDKKAKSLETWKPRNEIAGPPEAAEVEASGGGRVDRRFQHTHSTPSVHRRAPSND